MEICKHKEQCGGCIYQGIPYKDQIILKGKEVLRLLDEKGISYEKNLGIEGSPSSTAYRNKMEYTFGNEVKDGPVTLGMHMKGRFMSIATVDECQLVDPDFNLVLRKTLDFCEQKGYSFYHKKQHKGLLRNLIVRKGEHTQQLLINIVTSSQATFDSEAYVAAIRQLSLSNEVVGILHTINDNLSDAVRVDRLTTLWGRDYYEEEIMGLKFKVSAFSFFQTNVRAIEKLYTEATNLVKDVEGKTIFDLYCGTGTIAQTLALRAKKVVGVEIVEDAVEAARKNAELNELDNCEFIAGDVLAVLDELTDVPDVIFLDPPRPGIHPKALEKILNYGVKEIVYISCNPKSLAVNLEVMQERGYGVKSVKTFDNFPFTKHIECVVLLTLRDDEEKAV